MHVKEDSCVITGQCYVMKVKCTPLGHQNLAVFGQLLVKNSRLQGHNTEILSISCTEANNWQFGAVKCLMTGPSSRAV